jgi:peptidoglycan/LPS O-acetylase OafA/YrhL
LVLVYHAGLPFVPAGFIGVDVFFVISGFLITTQLVAELERTGRISLPRFYARRAKRLLPAAAAVLATTAALVYFFIPKIRWQEIGGDIIGSALYVVNWRLADRAVNYLAEDSQPSPVQHFWSLAVEEQYYLVWPVLILIAALVARGFGGRTRPVLWIGLALIAVPSFGWAITQTAYAPERAFFVTTTRMWELAIGAATALGAGSFARWRRAPAIALGWAGLAMVAASAIAFSSRTPWPSYAAALPTLGAAAVIGAGFAVGHGGPAELLAASPFRWLGGLSYSIYLWHWPLLVAATAYLGDLTPATGTIVAICSIAPAWLSHRLIENPVRYSVAISRSPRLALSLGANFTLIGVIGGLAILLAVATSGASAREGSNAALGAAVLAANPRNDPAGAPRDRVGLITPDPLRATADIPDADRTGCIQKLTDAPVLTCTYGNEHSDTTVAVVGDSKVAQWLPALQLLADQNDWKLLVFTKSSCSFSTAVTADKNDQPYETCTRWNRELLPRLTHLRPDYVITSQGSPSAVLADGTLSADSMVDGMRESWSALVAVGSQIIVIADNPHPGMNVYECVEENRDNLSKCTYDRDRRLTKGAFTTQRLAVMGQHHVRMIDLFDAVCPTDQCAAVIGNVLVYRQGAHITATYVKTLAPRLADALSGVGLRARFDR